jgi:hypothetical protein
MQIIKGTGVNAQVYTTLQLLLLLQLVQPVWCVLGHCLAVYWWVCGAAVCRHVSCAHFSDPVATNPVAAASAEAVALNTGRTKAVPRLLLLLMHKLIVLHERVPCKLAATSDMQPLLKSTDAVITPTAAAAAAVPTEHLILATKQAAHQLAMEHRAQRRPLTLTAAIHICC